MTAPTLIEFLLERLADDETTWRTVYAPTNPMGEFLLADVAAKRRIVERLAQVERLIAANAAAHTEASHHGLAEEPRIVALRRHGWELAGRRDALRLVVDELVSVYGDALGFRDEWRP